MNRNQEEKASRKAAKFLLCDTFATLRLSVKVFALSEILNKRQLRYNHVTALGMERIGESDFELFHSRFSREGFASQCEKSEQGNSRI